MDGQLQLFSSLRYPGFRRLWIGNVVSGCGIWAQNLALGLIISRYRHAGLLLGIYAFASLAPIVPFSLVGGALADRFDRRKILLVVQLSLLVLTLALAGLSRWHLLNYAYIVAVTGLTGVAVAINSPAYQAFVSDLVPAESLANAIAVNSVQFNAARIVGHALAGLVMFSIGEFGCFIFNALTYVSMIVALLCICSVPVVQKKHQTSFRRRVSGGFKFLSSHRDLLRLIAVLGLMSFLGLPYFYMLPRWAAETLHLDARWLGYLTASVSVGGIIAALSVASISRRFSRQGVLVSSCMLFWFALFAFAISRNSFAAMLLLIALGFSLVVTTISINHHLQASTPADFRGRVMSIYGIAINGMAPLGSLVIGALATAFNSAAMAIAGAAALGIACCGLMLVRRSGGVMLSSC